MWEWRWCVYSSILSFSPLHSHLSLLLWERKDRTGKSVNGRWRRTKKEETRLEKAEKGRLKWIVSLFEWGEMEREKERWDEDWCWRNTRRKLRQASRCLHPVSLSLLLHRAPFYYSSFCLHVLNCLFSFLHLFPLRITWNIQKDKGGWWKREGVREEGIGRDRQKTRKVSRKEVRRKGRRTTNERGKKNRTSLNCQRERVKKEERE